MIHGDCSSNSRSRSICVLRLPGSSGSSFRNEARKAEGAKSGRLTADGIKADALQFATQQLAVGFRRGKHQLDAAKREAADLRSKIALQPVDKTDLVSAMLRAEMRDYLRSKTQSERDAFIRENANTLDPEMARAFTEVPPEISGISTVQREALLEKALEAQHPGALQEVQELERAIELAEKAVNLGRDEIIREAETDSHHFNELAKPYEARAAGA